MLAMMKFIGSTTDETDGSGPGYAVARQLGLEAYFDMSGDDGTAYFLEDGRILKVTNDLEAAIALRLMDLQDLPGAHSATPRIYDVRKFNRVLLVNGQSVSYQSYLIIRDDTTDFPGEDLDEDWAYDWQEDLMKIAAYWRVLPLDQFKALPDVQSMMKKSSYHKDLISNLVWMAEMAGVKIADIKASNLGTNEDGRLGVRDMSRGNVPEDLLRALINIKDVIDRPVPPRMMKICM